MKPWEVMKAFDEGAKIECRRRDDCYWMSTRIPCWNWDTFEYRVVEGTEPKQEPLQGIYEAKGVKFPAWVEVRDYAEGDWKKRECLGIDGSNRAVCLSSNGGTGLPWNHWRPIQPKQEPSHSVEDLKSMAYLGFNWSKS